MDFQVRSTLTLFRTNMLLYPLAFDTMFVMPVSVKYTSGRQETGITPVHDLLYGAHRESGV